MRQYARLIVEKAYSLRTITNEQYQLSLPPYSSEYDLVPISDEEIKLKIGGDVSHGTKKLLYSIGVMQNGSGLHSDFYRYTLGGNYRSDTDFSNCDLTSTVLDQDDMITVEELTRFITAEVYKLGWSERLGILDNNRYSQGRHENNKERLGKKYQKLALYSVLSKIADNKKVKGRWVKSFIRYSNPIDIGFADYFDPSIHLSPLELHVEEPIIIKSLSSDILEDDWLENDSNVDFDTKILELKIEGEKWIRISGIDVQKQEVPESLQRELFYRYDTYFVNNSDKDIYLEWAKDQNFFGRWMPEVRDLIGFRLFEYNWADTYKSIGIENKIEVKQNQCPVNVTVSTYTHLQEDFNGLINEDDMNRSTSLPCEDLVTKMNLKLRLIRGGVYDSSDRLAAFDGEYLKNRKSGLFIRQDILNEYLSITNQTLVLAVLGSKELRSGYNYLEGNDITGSYYYDGEKYVGKSIIEKESKE